MADKKEALLETLAPFTLSANLTGTITCAAGANNVVGVGTLFTTELAVGGILTTTDTSGKLIYKTVLAIANDLLCTTVDNFVTAVAALSNLQVATTTSPYIYTSDDAAPLYPNKVPIYGGTTQFELYEPWQTRLGAANRWIDNSEGIEIKSIYMRLPYQHTMADGPIAISIFQYDEVGAVHTAIQEIGVSGVLFTQIENAEIPINKFIPPYAVAIANGVNWSMEIVVQGSPLTQNDYAAMALNAKQGAPYISTVNVPTALNDELLPIVFGVRFTHGIGLSS